MTLKRTRVARAGGVVVAGLGLLVLAGWLLDVDLLRRIWPGVPPTKANAALMFVLMGAGLAFFATAVPTRLQRLAAIAAGGFGALVSAVTLLEYLWRGLGVDELLVRDTTGSIFPGRPSPHAAVGILLVGANMALLAVARTRKGQRAAAWINNALALVVMAGVIGYAYNVDYLRGFSSVNGIGIVALVSLAILNAALAALAPEGTWLAIFISPSAGGRMARRFAPLVLLLPVLLGVQMALYNHPLGHAISAVVATVATITALIVGAYALDRAEAQRQALSGLLPICAHCKRIRDDKGYWSQVELYVSEHSEADFSHSICPDCLEEFYPEHADVVKEMLGQRKAAT